MAPLHKNIEEATERFVEDMIGMIRTAAREQILRAMGMEGFGTPQLPMPKRKSKYLAEPKTRGPRTKDLTPPLAKAYRRLKKSKRPVTVSSTAKMLKMSESNARGVLSKLLQKRLASTERLGDGTARKVYLLG